jgi:SAM-dependent methyltransferase
MKENKNSLSEIWDLHWDINKKMLKIYELVDIFIYLWFEIGNILFNSIDRDKKQKFIEFGCGGGTFLPYFLRKYNNLEIFGIDISPVGCKMALKRTKGKINTSNIIRGDILTNNFQDRFDICFSFGLIEHYENSGFIIKKHVEILKKDGIMICILPNLVGLQGKILKSKIWYTEEKWKKNPKGWIFEMKPISVESLKKWCKSAGLKDIKVRPIGGFFPFFLIESINFQKKSSGDFLKNMHRILLPLFIIINIPTFIRMNSNSFSPYLIAIGKKT